jgi:epoxyqueuosine reductase
MDVMDPDGAVASFVGQHEIPLFGIASAKGFCHALPGWHPKELMPNCESVLVFGGPYVEHPLQVQERTHVANESWWEANQVVLDQNASWKGGLVGVMDEFGLGVASFGGFNFATEGTFSYRLAQVQAGMGVYGRIGVCLNPDYGCFYHVGVLLTEAELTPISSIAVRGFEPCEDCSECADVCPVRAIDVSKEPGTGYNRELCIRFLLKAKERHGSEAKMCARCFSACPWSMGRLGTIR